MSILTRYIAAFWLRMLFLCQGSFIAIYLVLDMMEKIPRFLRAGGELQSIASFFFWKLPEMIGQTAGFSILMATLLTLGLLSRNSEITAMRSCGVSLFRIATPMLALGFLASLLLLANAELVLPESSQRMDRIERVDIKKKGINAVFRRNNIWFRSDRSILQAQLFEAESQTLKGVVLWKLDQAMNPLSRIDAESAEFRGGRWIATKPVIKEFAKGRPPVIRKSSSMDLGLELKVDDLRVLNKNADSLSFRTLKEYAENLQNGGYPAFMYLTMMHAKISAPFSAFVMVILGIPFALRNSRSGGIALGIGASVAIGFVYFVVNAILLSYGRSGALPPMLAAWGADLLFLMGGIWLSMTIRN